MLRSAEPLQRRNTAPLVIVMGSLGVTGMVENLLALAFGPTGYGLPGESWPPFLWGGLIVSVAQLIAPAAMLAAVIGAILVLSWTGLGRRLRALMEDDKLLGLQGVDTTRLKRLAFAAGSALLALPAVLLLMSGAGVTPFVGIDAVLTGAMSVFVGGAGSGRGGGRRFLIGLIENLAAFFVPTSWQVPVTAPAARLSAAASDRAARARACAEHDLTWRVHRRRAGYYPASSRSWRPAWTC